MLEIIISVLYVCVAFFTMSVFYGMNDGDFDVPLAFGGMLWPIVWSLIIITCLMFPLLRFGKRLGEWIGDRIA